MIVVIQRTPIAKGREREFKIFFSDRPKLVDMMPGFIRHEFLRPIHGEYYTILSYWESQEDFEAWLKSDAHRKIQGRKHAADPLLDSSQYELHEVIGVSQRIREMKD